MTNNYKKKLIEVAIPLEAINAASAREKSIRHGHPSTLHLWWARRPLAACRAVLFAQLVDDPSGHPDKFPNEDAVEAERKRLFLIIEDLVKWENSTNEEVLTRARNEIMRSCEGKLPPIYDPFSGGGSIPLEAQRLGLPAYGSDLNPVAVMIGKAMIEIPPKFKDMPPIHPGDKDAGHGGYKNAQGLSEDVKYYGDWMRKKAFERIGHLYPKVTLPKELGGGDATVVSWIWARTVPSPDPAFSDAQTPLVSSFLLSSKKGKAVWIEPAVDKMTKKIEFRIRYGGTEEEIKIAREGTKRGRGSNFKCILSETAITPDYVRQHGKTSGFGERLIAIVASTPRGRVFLPPDVKYEATAFSVEPKNRPTQKQARNPRWFSPPEYGMETFGELFTKRQLVLLETYSELVREVRSEVLRDTVGKFEDSDTNSLNDGGKGSFAYAEAISLYLAMGVSRLSDIQNAFCMWESSKTQVRHLFTRHAIPMLWDFAEAGAFSGSAGGFRVSLNSITKAIDRFIPASTGNEIQHDAQSVEYPEGAVISCDPPYYDNIGYADVSDFFFCWLRPALKDIFPEIFGVLATPKSEELVATPYRHGGKVGAEKFFLSGMRNAIKNMVDQTGFEFPATIFYAFKQSEIAKEGISSTGWATFLQAVVEAGYAVVGTWPMRTELSNRMIASGTNALANSVVLVCRKKVATAETITRAEFLRTLKRELPPAIAELQAANVSPADMPQSAIGPGMGVFSRFKAVLEADDSKMTVKTALQLINRELDDFLNDIQGEFDPETRFSLTWFEQNGLENGEFGVADSLARARGISVDDVKHAGIVKSEAGKVRILKRDELLEDWDPKTDTHLTIWECCQYLVLALESEGEYAAALLLKKMGAGRAEAVKDLAYCLHDICSNKRKDAKEATSYNALIAVWTELTRQAASISDHEMTGDRQTAMKI